jgi:2-(1,2-epoxy-1,2-dihydrophenyl)acetyl-CoA isomerase
MPRPVSTSVPQEPSLTPLDDSPISYDVTDGIATVALSRPDSMNSLTLAMKVALRDALHAAAADSAARCVVLRGSGRAFCVGQDLREHVERDLSEPGLDTVAEHYNPMVTAIATMPKPVIAAVNGIAAGAGSGCSLVRRVSTQHSPPSPSPATPAPRGRCLG